MSRSILSRIPAPPGPSTQEDKPLPEGPGSVTSSDQKVRRAVPATPYPSVRRVHCPVSYRKRLSRIAHFLGCPRYPQKKPIYKANAPEKASRRSAASIVERRAALSLSSVPERYAGAPHCRLSSGSVAYDTRPGSGSRGSRPISRRIWSYARPARNVVPVRVPQRVWRRQFLA